MGWIVGVTGTGSALVLVESRAGVLRGVSAKDASLDIEDVPKGRRTRFVEVELAEFERLDEQQSIHVAARLGIPTAVPAVQSLWNLRLGSRRIVVPSQVFIQAFAGSSRAHRSALLSPAGFQTLGALTVADGALGVTYFSHFEKKSPDRARGLTQTILWTGSYPSAKRMQSSVFRHALDGRFDIDFPKARVTMAFAGVEDADGTLLATRITLAAVEPLEPPMEHAAGLAPTKFDFAFVDERRLVKGTGNQGPRGPKLSGVEPDLAGDRYATALQDSEWARVRSILERRRAYKRQLDAREREKMDIILCKLSTGKPWTEVAGSTAKAQLVQRYFRDIDANGSWAEVKAMLVAARGGGNGARSDVSAVDDYSPAGLRRIRTHIAKMTQPQFAALLQVGASTVSGWERGEREPKGAATRRLQLLLLGGVEALSKQVD